MKKQLSVFFLIFSFSFILSGCFGKNKANESTPPLNTTSGTGELPNEDTAPSEPLIRDGRYVNLEEDFSLAFPENWTVKQEHGNTTVSAVSPLENPVDQFAENMNVIIEGPLSGMGLQEYYDLNIKNLEPYVQNFVKVSEKEVEANGNSGKMLEYTASFEGIAVHSLAYFFTYNDQGYVITCTAKNESIEQYRAQFEEAVLSLEFGEE
jgi:hypothetical protein